MKWIVISNNRSLDGILYKLWSDQLEELSEVSSEEEDFKSKATKVKVKWTTKLAVKVKSVKFSPDGRSFAVATSEGVLIYSLDQT